MKRFLLPHLICPACLPREIGLELSSDHEVREDIVTGSLTCSRCKIRYPIRDGVAQLLPDPATGPTGGQWRYEEPGSVARYLWSHYADLAGDPENAQAIAAWSDCLLKQSLSAIDAGCSVGRLTFEMGARNDWAVGCDLSLSFIKAARRLAQERQLSFSLPLEGTIQETFRVTLPESWSTDHLEFVVADALRLPFARHTFQQSASLNLLDRVSYPLAHLYEMNRVAVPRNGAFLFASPFSWERTAAPEELWLGGTLVGKYRGAGIENVRLLLEGGEKILSPPWHVSASGAITWLMRSHRNHRELIRSEFLNVVRR